MLPFFASAQSHIIEVADFKCKYCLEAEPQTAILRQATKLNGDKFVFAPVDNLAKDHFDLTDELFYYAIKDTHPKEEIIRESLFEMNQTLQLKMESYEELIDWLSIYSGTDGLDKKGLIEASNESLQNFTNITSLRKTLRLIRQHNIKSTPAFILVSNKGEERLVIRPPETTVGAYINITLEAYKRMKKSEN